MKAIKILFIFISLSSFAQSKVGTIDIDFILSKMPELPEIQKQIEDYGKELDVDFNENLDSYNALVKAYTDGETGFSEAEKKEKQTEILTAENDLGKFQQNGTKLISIKRDDLVRPLYQKIGVALEKIAKAEGYTQVLQIDKNIVYLDNNLDLTLLVLKELGIELKEGE
jgi:outer membrane protein